MLTIEIGPNLLKVAALAALVVLVVQWWWFRLRGKGPR
jgi:hypothetical protein